MLIPKIDMATEAVILNQAMDISNLQQRLDVAWKSAEEERNIVDKYKKELEISRKAHSSMGESWMREAEKVTALRLEIARIKSEITKLYKNRDNDYSSYNEGWNDAIDLCEQIADGMSIKADTL